MGLKGAWSSSCPTPSFHLLPESQAPETLRGGTQPTASVAKLGTELGVLDGTWFQNQSNRAVNSCTATVQPVNLDQGPVFPESQSPHLHCIACRAAVETAC